MLVPLLPGFMYCEQDFMTSGVEAVESISTISLCLDVLSTLETHSENLASCCLCIHMNTGKLRGGNALTSCARVAVLAYRSTPSAPLRSAPRQADAQHSLLPAKACSCNHWSVIRRGCYYIRGVSRCEPAYSLQKGLLGFWGSGAV